jgi:hypothetical protein
MEGAHQVLPGFDVHARLPADGRVDHGHQGRGHLDHRNAPQKRRGDESGEITRHAPAQGDDHGVPPQAGGQHLVREDGPALPRLVGLPLREGEQIRVKAVVTAVVPGRRSVEGGNPLVGYQRVPAGGGVLHQEARKLLEEARPDEDGIATRTTPHVDTRPSPLSGHRVLSP